MYKYLIGTYDNEREDVIELWHEKLFKDEEYQEIVSKCFAKSIFKYRYFEKSLNHNFNQNLKGIHVIYLSMFTNDVKETMILEYGFKYKEIEKPTNSFIPYWVLNDCKEYELIIKHINYILDETGRKIIR